MIVIGAGPAGLATAAVARQQGLRPTVLDRGQAVGDSWAGRYDSLRLHTVRWLSGLPGMPIPRRYGRWVRRDDFVSYLRAYADRFSIKPEFGVSVDRIDRGGAGWIVSAGDRRWESDQVVVATGVGRRPHLPDWPGLEAYRRSLIHSATYRNAVPYAGQHVLVVGAGNSACEIATDLVDGGARVSLAVRTPPNVVRRSSLGIPSQLIGLASLPLGERLMNPLGGLLRRLTVPDLSAYGLPMPEQGYSQFLRTRTVPVIDHGFVDRLRSGGISVVAAVAGFDGDRVLLADGSSIEPDAVVSATGYRPDLAPLVGPLGVLDADGFPTAETGGTLSDAPGLYFVGIEIVLAGLLHDIAADAERVGRSLVS